MLKNETSHRLDENNKKSTSVLLLFFGAVLFVLGILVLQAPVLPDCTDANILMRGVTGCIFLIIGALGVLFGIFIPFFKFEKIETFKDLLLKQY